MKVFIVDDEVKLRNYMLSLLAELMPEAVAIGTAGSVEEALVLIPTLKPDLLLLDIELPDGKGFQIVQRLKSFEGKVIFITAHDKFALQAIKCSALDYLLKPLDEDEFETALLKAKEELSLLKKKESLYAQLEILENNLAQQTEKKIVVKNASEIHLLKVNDILRLKADSNYTELHLKGKKVVLASKTLKEFDSMLSSSNFFRVHQSHLVNLNYVEKIDKEQGLTLVLEDGSEVPISTRKKDLLLQRLEA